MTSQYRHRRTSIPSTAFTTLEPGEISVNTANRQIAVGDAQSGSLGNPLNLLAIRYFDARAQYAASDYVIQAGVIYRAKASVPPGAFNASQWDFITGGINPIYILKAGDVMTGALTVVHPPSANTDASSKQYVDSNVATRLPLAGGTVTGPIVLPGNPVNGLEATSKTYVDGQIAAKAAVFCSDTPPVGVPDNSLWFETDSGMMYVRYNDGDSTQWVVAMPLPDTTLFATKAYVDAFPGVHYDIAQTLTAGQKAQARTNIDVPIVKKNYIINGAMQISQENGATAGTVNVYYPVDQFYDSYVSGTLTLQQVASVTPGGSPNRLRATATVAKTPVVAGDYALLVHSIEGLRTADLRIGSAAAKTVTLQFGVKAPAGTYCVVFGAANNRSYVAEYTIAAGEANTDVVKSVTVALDQAGTWAISNAIGLNVFWSLMAGSTYQGAAGSWLAVGSIFGSVNQFNFMGTVNNTFELFDVGLYEGTVAPAFQVPDYANELQACRRYWTRETQFLQAPAASSMVTAYPFKVQMRVTPTMTTFSQSSSVATMSMNSASADAVNYQVSASAAGGYVTLTFNANARL